MLTTKGILKNAGKFNDIKLAKGVDISLYTTKARSTTGIKKIGVSTAMFGKRWFVTPKGRAIFKTFDDEYGDEIRRVRIVNELLCKELCDQIGLGCAEYKLAHIGDIDGLITYDIAGNNTLINMEELLKIDKTLQPNLLDCAKALDIYKANGYKLDKRKIIVNLYKTILFDTLTLQTDRNSGNVLFLLDEKNKTIMPAKIIDNEFAFYGEGVSAYKNRKPPVTMSLGQLLDEHSLLSKIFTFDSCYVSNAKHYTNNICDLTFYAKKHPALMTALNDALKNIDIDKAIKNVEQMGVEINEEYKQYVQTIISETKKLIQDQKSKRVSKLAIDDVENIY